MSLDVYLIDPKLTMEECVCTRCDHEHVHTYNKNLYQANITHNLGRMADACGLYDCLWRPDENDMKIAADIIPFLEKGYKELSDNREKYIKYNASNGWGSYDGFCKWVYNYLQACKEYPNAIIEVSR